MKHLLLLLSLLLAIGAQTALAQIHIVNNNGEGDFTTAQDASDNAAFGDTLYLVPSATNYALSVIDKPLVIIGSGYFLSENGILVNGSTSQNSRLDLGGTILASANGIKFMGLEVGVNSRLSAAQKVTFVRCRVKSYLYPDIDGIEVVLESCWVDYIQSYGGNFFKVTAKNSYIDYLYASHGSVIQNCINIGYATIYNSSVYNNIFLNVTSSNFSTHWVASNNNTVSYNFYVIAEPTSGDIGNNNRFSMATSAIFVAASGQPTDGVYKLRTGSPARGAGLNGVDVGMFGGPTPYIQAGQPPIPFLTNIKLDQVVSQESGMNFSVTFESRN